MNEARFEPVAHAAPGDVRVWHVDLDVYAAGTAFDDSSASERERASRMDAPRAMRFLAARHALRSRLAAALDRPAASLALRTGVFGKPYLADDALQFSVSHCEAVCLIAVSRHTAVGIDVEMVRDVPDADALARSHFTRNERREWSAGGASASAFLTCWTRKEACLKALGVGLAVQPSSIEAGCSNLTGRVPARIDDHAYELSVYLLEGVAGAIGALALTSIESASRPGGPAVSR